MEEIEVASSTSEGAPDNVREDCCPGAPFITFRSPAPSLPLTLINPQLYSGYLTHWLPVRSGDTVTKLATSLGRADKKITGTRDLAQGFESCVTWQICSFKRKLRYMRYRQKVPGIKCTNTVVTSGNFVM